MLGTADRKLARQLEKMEKEALQEAKSLHVREGECITRVCAD